MFLSIHPVCCSPFRWTSLLTFSDLSKFLKYGAVKTKLLPKLSPSVSWQLPTSSPCPGQFTVLVTFWCSLCFLSPACLPTLCLSVSMSISSSSAWAHSGSHYLFLFAAATSSPEAPVDFFITSATPLLPEKSFIFSKIIPYPWLPLFSAQSCISFSNYIRSKSLSTSLMWFLEHLLSLTLLCATPVFPGSYLNLFIGFLSARSWDFSHLWDGR